MSRSLESWVGISTAVGTLAAAGAAWWTAWLARRSAADSARAAEHALEALARTLRPTLDISCGAPLGTPDASPSTTRFGLLNNSVFDAVDVDVAVNLDGRSVLRKTGLALSAKGDLQLGTYDSSPYPPGGPGPDVSVEITYSDERRAGRWMMTVSSDTSIDYTTDGNPDPDAEHVVVAQWVQLNHYSPTYRYLGPS